MAATDITIEIAQEFEQLVANRSTVKAQSRELGGRKYLVCPVVMIKQGVLSGNNGPILYTNSVVSKRVQRWNGVPLTLGHPEDENGNKISGRDPETADKFQIGVVYNARHVGDKLKGEAWFDVQRLDKLAPGLKSKLQKGDKVELSTGLFTYATNKSGTHNGRPYKQTLQGYEPDHLAVLTNEKGACSCEDGCGVNTNSHVEDDMPAETVELDQLGATVVVNSMSDLDVRAGLSKLLRETHKSTGANGEAMRHSYAYVKDVYPTHFTYMDGDACFKQEYTRSSDTLTFKGSPVEVISSTVYKPVSKTKESITFQVTGNAKKKSGGGSCGIGPGGFQPGNTCAKGSGRAGFGQAATATPAQKKAAKKRSGSSGSGTKSDKPKRDTLASRLAEQNKGLSVGKKAQEASQSDKDIPKSVSSLKIGTHQKKDGTTTVQVSETPAKVRSTLKSEGYEVSKRHKDVLGGTTWEKSDGSTATVMKSYGARGGLEIDFKPSTAPKVVPKKTPKRADTPLGRSNKLADQVASGDLSGLEGASVSKIHSIQKRMRSRGDYPVDVPLGTTKAEKLANLKKVVGSSSTTAPKKAATKRSTSGTKGTKKKSSTVTTDPGQKKEIQTHVTGKLSKINSSLKTGDWDTAESAMRGLSDGLHERNPARAIVSKAVTRYRRQIEDGDEYGAKETMSKLSKSMARLSK